MLRNKVEDSRQHEAEQRILNSEGLDFGVREPDFEKMQSRDKSDSNLFASCFGTKVDNFSLKAMKELEQFDVYFRQLLSNPSVRATISSEVSRLSELKNCEYHR